MVRENAFSVLQIAGSEVSVHESTVNNIARPLTLFKSRLISAVGDTHYKVLLCL